MCVFWEERWGRGLIFCACMREQSDVVYMCMGVCLHVCDRTLY